MYQIGPVTAHAKMRRSIRNFDLAAEQRADVHRFTPSEAWIDDALRAFDNLLLLSLGDPKDMRSRIAALHLFLAKLGQQLHGRLHPRALRFVVVLVPADGLLSKREKVRARARCLRDVMRYF